MVELGTRAAIERVAVGNSPPKAARACALLGEFLPVFGVKGKQVMGSLAAGYDPKMTTFCARKGYK